MDGTTRTEQLLSRSPSEATCPSAVAERTRPAWVANGTMSASIASSLAASSAFVTLSITNRYEVVSVQPEFAERGMHAARLRHTRRQHHPLTPIVDELALEAP